MRSTHDPAAAPLLAGSVASSSPDRGLPLAVAPVDHDLPLAASPVDHDPSAAKDPWWDEPLPPDPLDPAALRALPEPVETPPMAQVWGPTPAEAVAAWRFAHQPVGTATVQSSSVDTGGTEATTAHSPSGTAKAARDTEATRDAEAALESTAPGPALAELLDAVDLGSVCTTDATVVAAAAGSARLAAWAAAVEHDAIRALHSRVRGWRGVGEPASGGPVDPTKVSPALMVSTEIGAALALSPQAARNRVELALSLGRLPRARAALAGGVIDLRKARDLAEHLAVLDDEAAGRVEAHVLARADGRTAAMLAAATRRAVLAADPASAQARRERALAERGVRHAAMPDGMAELVWTDTAESVQRTWLWLTGAAHAALGPDDHRSLDQARADVLGDVGTRALETFDLPTRQGRRPNIGVVVAASTLLGLDDQPGELLGYGPVTAETARRIAGEGTWRRLLTDPAGNLLDLSTTRYEPPKALREHVLGRDRTCRGPGCRRAAEQCDLDHTVPYPSGPTSAENLHPACRPWHRVKTHTDTLVTATADGGLRTKLPSGRATTRAPDPVLADVTSLTSAHHRDLPPF